MPTLPLFSPLICLGLTLWRFLLQNTVPIALNRCLVLLRSNSYLPNVLAGYNCGLFAKCGGLSLMTDLHYLQKIGAPGVIAPL